MKKKIKTIKKDTSSSRKEDQLGAVLESMNSKIDLLLELHDISDKKIDRLHQEAKEDLNEFKIETRNNFKIFRADVDEKFKSVDKKFKSVDENFEKVFEFQDEAKKNFEKIFEFQDMAEGKFEVTLEYLSRLDDEIQSLREEMKQRPALAAIFEKRMKAMEKDLTLCKKALALR